MKLRPSHEFALAAATRVSCCAAVLAGAGCHPTTTTETAVADTAAADAGGDPGPIVAEPDPYVADPELDPSLRESPVSAERLAFQQCQTQVVAASEGGTLGANDDACCRSLAEHAYDGPDPELDEAAADAQRQHDGDVWMNIQGPCCELIDYELATCTPWGPPMPPSRLAARSTRPARRLNLRQAARRARPIGLETRAMDERLRAMAVATWRARMVNEHGSAVVFEGLVDQLDRLVALGHLTSREVAPARRFAPQERRHGVLCGAVVEALGGEAEAPALPEREFPNHALGHADADSELEACLRNVLSICCLSETVAVALIAAEREDMPEGPLRDLLTQIWADECGHARFGWRLLATLLPRTDAATRERLGDYLELALAELERHELAHLPVHASLPPGGASYGLCDGREARALFHATVERVITPGLAALGLRARAGVPATTPPVELRA